MDALITVVITTYNRKERLMNQLKSLFNQALYRKINIIVSDNCSDYNVFEALSESFSEKEMSVVEIIQKPYNTGMIGNISGAFLLAKTKWMWLLSDDDETTINSISIILKYIQLYQDSVALKFTDIFENKKNSYTTGDVNSIPQFLDFCEKSKIDLGNFIFMSNNIYNMEVIKPFLKMAFVHSYTYFPHIIPILTGLDNGQSLRFIPEAIVHYKEPEIRASSDYLVSIYLGAMSIADIPFNLSNKNFLRLIKFFNMNAFWDISNDFYNSSYMQKRFLYKKLFMAQTYKSIKNMLIFVLFDFQIYIGNNFISSYVSRFRRSIS